MFHYLRTGLESRNKNVDRYQRWSQNSNKIKDKNKGKIKTKSGNMTQVDGGGCCHGGAELANQYLSNQHMSYLVFQ